MAMQRVSLGVPKQGFEYELNDESNL